MPDNVLFEGGAGETIRRKLLHECDVHTLLRLPTGIFYAQGVKANVLFFDRKPAAETAWTRDALDLRPAHQHALHAEARTRSARRDLDDFVAATSRRTAASASSRERFKRFTYDELLQRDKVSLDLFWLRDESLEDIGQSAAARRHRRGDRRGPRSRAGQFAAIADALGIPSDRNDPA